VCSSDLGDRALVRVKFAGDQAKKRGFSRTIRTDQPHGLTRMEVARDVIEHNLPAELFANFVDSDRSHGGMIREEVRCEKRRVWRRFSRCCNAGRH